MELDAYHGYQRTTNSNQEYSLSLYTSGSTLNKTLTLTFLYHNYVTGCKVISHNNNNEIRPLET